MGLKNFNDVKERARNLIHNDAKKDAHIIKERNNDRAKTYSSLKGGWVGGDSFDNIASSYGNSNSTIASLQENYQDDDNGLNAAIDSKIASLIENRKATQTPQAIMPTKMPKNINTKLPKEILESFSKNFIDQSKLSNVSVLDTLGVQLPQEEKVIKEHVETPSNVIEVAEANGKVDYELIKNIVESSVKKYMAAYTKKIISESKTSLNEENGLAAIQFTGDKFVFVTKKGDLYEATLKFKKNVNDKK